VPVMALAYSADTSDWIAEYDPRGALPAERERRHGARGRVASPVDRLTTGADFSRAISAIFGMLEINAVDGCGKGGSVKPARRVIVDGACRLVAVARRVVAPSRPGG